MSNSGEEQSSITRKIGFRKVKLVQEPIKGAPGKLTMMNLNLIHSRHNGSKQTKSCHGKINLERVGVRSMIENHQWFGKQVSRETVVIYVMSIEKRQSLISQQESNP